jgi:hypothetical protein
VWVWRVRVFDSIEIEEACAGDALGEVGVVPIAAVVGQEPGRAERDDARFVGELAGVVLECRGQL